MYAQKREKKDERKELNLTECGIESRACRGSKRATRKPCTAEEGPSPSRRRRDREVRVSSAQGIDGLVQEPAYTRKDCVRFSAARSHQARNNSLTDSALCFSRSSCLLCEVMLAK